MRASGEMAAPRPTPGRRRWPRTFLIGLYLFRTAGGLIAGSLSGLPVLWRLWVAASRQPAGSQWAMMPA